MKPDRTGEYLFIDRDHHVVCFHGNVTREWAADEIEALGEGAIVGAPVHAWAHYGLGVDDCGDLVKNRIYTRSVKPENGRGWFAVSLCDVVPVTS
jgi:hypothetical protein